MRNTFLATTAAVFAVAAASQAIAQSEAFPLAPATSTVLEGGKGINLVSGERVTVVLDVTGAVSISKIEKLGWNAVAPGPGGTSSVPSSAEPGAVVYSLQGPVFKVENSLATPINYSASAKLDIRGQEFSQAVKTCTVTAGRAAFEMWSAGVTVSSMVVGAPVAHLGAPGCAS